MTGEFRRVSLLVVAVVVIATAFAIHRQYRKAVEYGVTAPLNAINTACLVYAQTYPKFGFPRELSQLGLDLRKPLGPDNSGLIDSLLASGVKGGYVYRYQPGSQDESGKTTTYSFTAVPREYAKGKKSYYCDQTGVIHFTDANRTPRADDPILTF
ncbi:MAG TPA: hypothetical protein VMI10_25580 [Terriglobales bacterium]|nr:hypothetical protein [Terriglobales bacterium]